ncbi:7856_t:CDS:1, partial [Diversispora eburnea]
HDYFDAQYMLGKSFYEGYGTKKNILNAIYWLNKAKESKNTDAKELLEEIINYM